MRKGFPAICVFLVTLAVCPIGQASGKPLPGQIMIDPEHPQWLKRHGGKHVFICGPGDPEDFLRSHGGDAKKDHTQNPFVDADPAKGLDERILKQWDVERNALNE